MLETIVEGIAGYYTRRANSLTRSKPAGFVEGLKNKLFLGAIDSRLAYALLRRWVNEGYVKPISNDPTNENILEHLVKFQKIAYALVPDQKDRVYETLVLESAIKSFEEAANGKDSNFAKKVRRTIGCIGEKGLETLVFKYGMRLAIDSIKEHFNGRNLLRETAIELLTACNAVPRCRGCYAKEDEGELDEKTFHRLLKETKKIGSRITFIVGGESLIRMEMLLRTLSNFPDMPFIVSTNGKLVDADYAKAVAKLGNVATFINTPGLELTSIMLRSDPNVWHDITTAAANLKKYGAMAGFVTTVYRSNFMEVSSPAFIEQMMRSGMAMGLYFPFQIPLGCPPGEEKPMIREMERQFSERLQTMSDNYPIVLIDTCKGGKSVDCPASKANMVYIKADLSVSPCPWKPLSSEDLSLRNHSLKEVLESAKYSAIRERGSGMCIGNDPELMAKLKGGENA